MCVTNKHMCANILYEKWNNLLEIVRQKQYKLMVLKRQPMTTRKYSVKSQLFMPSIIRHSQYKSSCQCGGGGDRNGGRFMNALCDNDSDSIELSCGSESADIE